MKYLNHHLGKLIIVAAIVLTGCQQKEESLASGTAEQSAAATQDVKILEGAITVKIPLDMNHIMDQGTVQGYAGSNGMAILLGSAPAANQQSSDLLAQTIANLKNLDPNAKEVRKYDVDMGGTRANALEIEMKSKGQKVFMTMALAIVNNNVISIQVTGPQGDAEEVQATAKRVFSSLVIANK
ncbi:hypothetical protein A7J71_20680 [Achromobacter insolitus]|uniref:DcrB-related protein n=1 Tax=Achromobacter insolitus TaxID=217204 RepID=UPI0007C6A3D2|nr:DcrB-related protein [Achromobacter insolitus]OAE71662.1 hypothetical protein A7J71_20680 [Achromobacter insolitus]OCZ52931.1 hypothetical protein A7P22_16170 [Achromobacter insolitus]